LIDDDLHEREEEKEGNEELPMPPLELVNKDMHERDDEEGGMRNYQCHLQSW